MIDPTNGRQRRYAAVVRALDWLARFRISDGPPGSAPRMEDRDGAVLSGRAAVVFALSR